MFKKVPVPSPTPKKVDSSDNTLFDMKDPLRKVKRLKKALEGYEKEEATIREQVLVYYKMYTNCTSTLPRYCPKFVETITWMMDSIKALENGTTRFQQLKLPSYTDIAKAERYSIQQKMGNSGKRLIQKRTCKEAAVLREKEYYENIIQKTKEWILEAEIKRGILDEFEERIEPFLNLGRTLYSLSINDLDINPGLWSELFPNGYPSREELEKMYALDESITTTLIDDNEDGGVVQISCKVPENSAVNPDHCKDNKFTVTLSCCEKCKASLLAKKQQREAGAEGDCSKEPESKEKGSEESPSKPQQAPCAWEQNIKSQAWWNSSSATVTGPEENPKSPAPDPAPESNANLAEFEEELEDWEVEEEEEWESESEDGKEELEDVGDEDEDEEELKENANIGIRGPNLLQIFKELSEKLKSPEFNGGQAQVISDDMDNGDGTRSSNAQTEYVDIDDGDLFQEVDPSIPLFEVEEESLARIALKDGNDYTTNEELPAITCYTMRGYIFMSST